MVAEEKDLDESEVPLPKKTGRRLKLNFFNLASKMKGKAKLAKKNVAEKRDFDESEVPLPKKTGRRLKNKNGKVVH